MPAALTAIAGHNRLPELQRQALHSVQLPVSPCRHAKTAADAAQRQKSRTAYPERGFQSVLRSSVYNFIGGAGQCPVEFWYKNLLGWVW